MKREKKRKIDVFKMEFIGWVGCGVERRVGMKVEVYFREEYVSVNIEWGLMVYLVLASLSMVLNVLLIYEWFFLFG